MAYKSFHEVEMAFKASGYKFHLTGSRYFGNHHSQSDWDYIVQNSAGVHDFLVDLGFTFTKDREHYNDVNTVSVYSLQYGVNTWEKIDVQLSRDINEKIAAQNCIVRFFPTGLTADKKMNSRIWEMVLYFNRLVKITSLEKAKAPSTLEDKAARLKKAWKR